jgi:arylsulfatase A-like enzyme
MSDRPNLVMFMPDQLRADAVGAFGNRIVQTPNIDALAARGTTFSNAFSQHSLCGPSRVSMFTGWYPHVQGHRTLTNLLKPWEPNLLKSLKESGYNVAWVGQRGDTFAPGVTEASTDFAGWIVKPKSGFMPSPFPDGHKLRYSFYHGKRAGDGVVLDFDEATAQSAEQWLASGPREPWVLFAALIFPHPPFEVEEPWFSMHPRRGLPKRAPAIFDDKPRYMRAMHERYELGRLDDDDYNEIVATYYGMIARVDSQLGRVMRAVDRAGFAPRTVTAFFTDHGEYAGDFGLVEKWPAGVSECLLRNPLIFAGPGIKEGHVSSEMAEMVDLTPTMLELAEQSPAYTQFGKSLVPLLRGDNVHHREAAFSEGGYLIEEEPQFEHAPFPYDRKAALEHEDPAANGRAIARRDHKWTYIYRLYEKPELYDRENDPLETTNLAGRAEHVERERTFRDQILAWLCRTSDVIPREEDPRFPKLEPRPFKKA